MSDPTHAKPASAGATQPERGGKYLTFFLGKEEYGIEILTVQEIIGLLPITRVPRTPDFIRGVINLRGKVIPIMDLRRRFAMDAIDQTEETCIIVVRAHGVEMGVVVDRVSEVANVPAGEIEDAPSFGTDVQTDYLLGIGKSEGRVRLLLAIDRVLSLQDVAAVQQSTAEAEATAA